MASPAVSAIQEDATQVSSDLTIDAVLGAAGQVKIWAPGDPYTVSLFYRYVCIEDLDELVEKLKSICSLLGILGRILVAPEGINGTLAGSDSAVQRFREVAILSDPRFRLLDWKTSSSNGPSEHLPFLSLSIRREKEILSAGKDGSKVIKQAVDFKEDTFGGLAGTGVHLTPQEFHEGISSEGAVVIDVRNEFEYDIGHFSGALGLKTFQYSESWAALDRIISAYGLNDGSKVAGADVSHVSSDSADLNASSTSDGNSCNSGTKKPVYLYCTGGIRCEKASAYMIEKGVKDVYQLQGGIHRYLEAYSSGGGRFIGKNFVFDSRVAVPATSASDEASRSASDTRPDDTNSSNNSDNSCEILGRCVDCNAPHDAFSGRVTCTVCRQPVLVCPACVDDNPHPEEYYCSRHRNLKNIYFTVLDRYSIPQLEGQKEIMENMLPGLRSKKDRHRRNTLQKQIDRINDLIRQKTANGNIGSNNCDVNSKSDPNCSDAASVSLTDTTTGTDNPNSIANNGTCINPKTKSGWGFWRT